MRLASFAVVAIVFLAYLPIVYSYTWQETRFGVASEVLQDLAGSSMGELGGAIDAIQRSPDLLFDERVRLALIDALHRANESYFGSAEMGDEQGSNEGLAELRIALIRVVRSLQDVRSIPALIDSLDVGRRTVRAVAEFGEPALEQVLAAWNDRETELYSNSLPMKLRNAGLVDVMSAMVAEGRVGTDARERISAIARDVLESRNSISLLGAGMGLALSLEDRVLVDQVERMARLPEQADSAVGESASAESIRQMATRYYGRYAGSRSTGNVGIELDPDDIGGVVMSGDGPEAGVWVVAETRDLPTRFIRSVVTDDEGRFVVPDLPEATYEVFVRGYGLADSVRVSATPGQVLDLDAIVAADARAAADVYPAAWWLSMMELPEGELSQQALGSRVGGCLSCHQIGNKATREISPSILNGVDSHLAAWDRRVGMGPVGASMSAMFRGLGRQRAMFADWTDRIAAGTVPTRTPPRPRGAERNVVVTLWDWGTERDGRTASTPSDVRDATVNANGRLYGVVQASDVLAVLDPVEHRATTIPIPSSAPRILTDTPASLYYGDDAFWAHAADPRSVVMDGQGRVWLTGRVRGADEQPPFCTDGGNAFAAYFPLERGTRQVFQYDPTSEQFSEVDTCFSADHNQLGQDERFYYGFGDGVGWVDVELWDETGDAEASQGWCPTVVDTNGDGVITPGWTEPEEPLDPARDHRVADGCSSAVVNAADGSVWCSGSGREGNTLVRLTLGDSPPETCVAEVYMPPRDIAAPSPYGSGGLQTTRDGLIWQDWPGSGHFASFDPRVCTVSNGRMAAGQRCPEGWRFHRVEGPTYLNSEIPISSDASYLTQIDRHDVLGFGLETPIYGAVNSDALEVFVPRSGEFITLRVPYPMGFFSRSSVGRIDDETSGWKGKGLWSSYSNNASWHLEGGPGTLPKAVKFQVRPHPLAK